LSSGTGHPVIEAASGADIARCVGEHLLPGDCVLFPCSGGLTARLIRRIQRRLLADLVERTDQIVPDAWLDLGYVPAATVPEGWIARAAEYTHAAVALPWGIAEMTTPRSRRRLWCEVVREARGTLLVRRPVTVLGCDYNADALSRAAAVADRRAADRERYPYTELLHYWVISWTWRKLARRRRFAEVFADPARDVCSGFAWAAWREAGLYAELVNVADGRPEAWYPGRLAFDCARLRTVCEIRISRNAGSLDSPHPSKDCATFAQSSGIPKG